MRSTSMKSDSVSSSSSSSSNNNNRREKMEKKGESVGEGGGENFVHCALLGDGMVGKTCLTLSYSQQLFTHTYTATVFDNYSVPLKVGGQDFVISVFDTAGQSDYESVRAYTYQESEVLVLCFSVCDRESFYSVVNSWLPEIQRHTKRRRPLLLVGTQIDLRTPSSPTAPTASKSSFPSSSTPSTSSTTSTTSSCSADEVSTEEGTQLAKMIGADCYIECSARSQEGLQQVFEHVVFSALKYRKKKSKIFSRLFGDRTLSNKSIKHLSSLLMDSNGNGKGQVPC